MASLLRVTRPYPLPADAELVTRDGRRHVRLAEGGRPVFYPLSKDGTKYLKPLAKWYGQYRDADRVVRRVPLSANREAARQMLAEIVKKVELARGGVRDPFEAHRQLPLAARQADQAVARCRAAFAGGRFRTLADLDAEAVERWPAGQRRTAGSAPRRATTT